MTEKTEKYVIYVDAIFGPGFEHDETGAVLIYDGRKAAEEALHDWCVDLLRANLDKLECGDLDWVMHGDSGEQATLRDAFQQAADEAEELVLMYLDDIDPKTGAFRLCGRWYSREGDLL